jgi:hypothetical protein
LAKLFGGWASTSLTWIRRDATARAEQPAPSGKAMMRERGERWHGLKKTPYTLDLQGSGA